VRLDNYIEKIFDDASEYILKCLVERQADLHDENLDFGIVYGCCQQILTTLARN